MLKILSFITCLVFIGSLANARVEQAISKPVLVMPHSDTDTSAAEFSEKVLPKSLTTADSSRSVVTKIIDNSLAYWWNNSEMKNTSVGQAAEAVQNKMKAEMDLGSSGQNKVDHKLSLKVLAMQALAKLEYKGWFKGALNYDAKSKTAEAEILENLSNNKDLVISHSVTSNENKSQLSLRWNW
ncbi:hypothetical protein K2P97_01460 [bacterium]|nr:hypothetical protein [bacterium]